jgi:hypothetical protein
MTNYLLIGLVAVWGGLQRPFPIPNGEAKDEACVPLTLETVDVINAPPSNTDGFSVADGRNRFRRCADCVACVQNC